LLGYLFFTERVTNINDNNKINYYLLDTVKLFYQNVLAREWLQLYTVFINNM
jgi:hypothetical protein